MINTAVYHSPIGDVVIKEIDGYIVGIKTMDESEKYDILMIAPEGNKPIQTCIEQLEEYFLGTRKVFDFCYKNEGTPFREKVWQELAQHVPYGSTLSYGELAKRVDNPRAARAVGSANHHNNLWIVVPCHRVIASDGTLGGYGGGLWRKQWLLDHEQKYK